MDVAWKDLEEFFFSFFFPFLFAKYSSLQTYPTLRNSLVRIRRVYDKRREAVRGLNLKKR